MNVPVGPEGSRCRPYPRELEADVETTSETIIRVRPILPEDGRALVDFHGKLSPQSVYRRFFFVHPRLSDAEVEHFTHVDYVDRLALVAEHDDGLVGVGRYDRAPGTHEAEVAFVVADAFQHQGIGTILLERLASAAWKCGIEVFTAQTLAENGDMLDVFMQSGFHVTSTTSWGTVSVRFPIEPDDAYRSACSTRHQLGEPQRDGRATA